MRNLICYSLVRKLKPYNSCVLIKTKAKPILTVSDPLKKATEVGERFVLTSHDYSHSRLRVGTNIRETIYSGTEHLISSWVR